MNHRKIWAYSSLIMFFLSTFFICLHQKSQTQQALPVWQPNPVVMNSLGPEVNMQGYGMRLPSGFEQGYADLLGKLQPLGLDMYLWYNDRHAPNSSGIAINIVRRINLHSPADTAQFALEQEKKGMDNFSSTSVEEGQINGLPFARIYWQATKKGSSSLYATSGFIYATTDWNKGIVITGHDRVPCAGEPCQYAPIGQPVLPSVEAAVLTFHKL